MRKTPRINQEEDEEDDSDDELALPFTVKVGATTATQLAQGNPTVTAAIGNLAQVRRSTRLAVQQEPQQFAVNARELRRLRRNDPVALAAVQALQRVRRSPRLAAT